MAKETAPETEAPEVLTEKRKQELLEAARQQAEEIPQSTPTIGPDMDPAPTLGSSSAGMTARSAVTPAAGFVEGVTVGGGVEGFQTPVYGPYSDYQVVTTEWGEYGVPKGHVLWFEAQMKFSAKSGDFFVAHLRRHAPPDKAPVHIQKLLGIGV